MTWVRLAIEKPRLRKTNWSSYPNWAKAFVSLDGLIICSMS